MASPRVSILMPVHNGERYLREAIDSMLLQTFRDFEFLIIDDGSSDRSVEIIESYRDPRIVLKRFPTNRGTVHALNAGLLAAAGEYIVRMDCDDISLPQRLETQVRFMDSHPDTGVSGTAMRLIKKGKLKNTRIQPESDEELKIALLFNTCFFHPTVIMRTGLVKEHPYPADLVYTQDYNYWTSLAPKTRFANLTDTLLYFREHDGQISSKKANLQITNARRIREAYLLRFTGKITSKELDTHQRIADNRRDIDLVNAKAWLERLVKINSETQQFSPEGFKIAMGRKWWYCCRKNAQQGKKTLQIYHSSVLQKYYKPAASKFMKFTLKCLVSINSATS